jgi:hypothetical protein
MSMEDDPWASEGWKAAARDYVKDAAARRPAGTGTIIPFREAQPIAALLPSDEDLGLGEWDAGKVTVLPPPREWLLGNIFARGFMSSLLADGGVGKTATRLAQLISLALGRSLTGEHVFQRCPSSGRLA